MTKIELRIDSSLKARASEAASQLGLGLSAVVRALLRYWLNAGAPDVSTADASSQPDIESIQAMTNDLARIAFMLHRMTLQSSTNPLIVSSDSLLGLMPDRCHLPDDQIGDNTELQDVTVVDDPLGQRT